MTPNSISPRKNRGATTAAGRIWIRNLRVDDSRFPCSARRPCDAACLVLWHHVPQQFWTDAEAQTVVNCVCSGTVLDVKRADAYSGSCCGPGERACRKR